MFWTKQHDVLFCREILVSKLFETRKSSVERGKVWDIIAANLNSVKQTTFDVDKRSVRDHLNSLVSKYKKKIRREENASGISPELSELDKLLEEICGLESASIDIQNLSTIEKNKKVICDKETAEDIRQTAMESFAETKKRKASENDKEKPAAKRRSSNETIEYLKFKACQDNATKTQQLEMKQQEKEQQARFQTQQVQVLQAMMDQQQKQIQQQQQMQNILIQQQQQQTQAMMSLLEKVVPK